MKSVASRNSNIPQGIRVIALGVVTAASISACSIGSSQPDPGAMQTPVPPATSTAVFENFTVTVSRIDDDATSKRSMVQAKVCVTSLPSSYIGKRIRVSWDPWSVTAGAKTAAPGYAGKVPAGLFRADGDYKVGGCVSGLIPFEITGSLDSVKYDNYVGDAATWDAASLHLRPPN